MKKIIKYSFLSFLIPMNIFLLISCKETKEILTISVNESKIKDMYNNNLVRGDDVDEISFNIASNDEIVKMTINKNNTYQDVLNMFSNNNHIAIFVPKYVNNNMKPFYTKMNGKINTIKENYPDNDRIDYRGEYNLNVEADSSVYKYNGGESFCFGNLVTEITDVATSNIGEINNSSNDELLNRGCYDLYGISNDIYTFEYATTYPIGYSCFTKKLSDDSWTYLKPDENNKAFYINIESSDMYDFYQKMYKDYSYGKLTYRPRYFEGKKDIQTHAYMFDFDALFCRFDMIDSDNYYYKKYDSFYRLGVFKGSIELTSNYLIIKHRTNADAIYNLLNEYEWGLIDEDELNSLLKTSTIKNNIKKSYLEEEIWIDYKNINVYTESNDYYTYLRDDIGYDYYKRKIVFNEERNFTWESDKKYKQFENDYISEEYSELIGKKCKYKTSKNYEYELYPIDITHDEVDDKITDFKNYCKNNNVLDN